MSLLKGLEEGECCMYNDGNTKGLNRVLSHVTGRDYEYMGGYYYYFKCIDSWDCSDASPYGMDVHSATEFEKELDGFPVADNSELLAELAKETKRADKAEAKIAELQPYERGAEGWSFNGGWNHDKALYLACFRNDSNDLIHVCRRIKDGTVFCCADFTTENPHKKETVLSYQTDTKEFNKSLINALLVVLFTDYHNQEKIMVYMNNNDIFHTYITQLGDDLKEKFDDPDNSKYIDLTK